MLNIGVGNPGVVQCIFEPPHPPSCLLGELDFKTRESSSPGHDFSWLEGGLCRSFRRREFVLARVTCWEKLAVPRLRMGLKRNFNFRIYTILRSNTNVPSHRCLLCSRSFLFRLCFSFFFVSLDVNQILLTFYFRSNSKFSPL